MADLIRQSQEANDPRTDMQIDAPPRVPPEQTAPAVDSTINTIPAEQSIAAAEADPAPQVEFGQELPTPPSILNTPQQGFQGPSLEQGYVAPGSEYGEISQPYVTNAQQRTQQNLIDTSNVTQYRAPVDPQYMGNNFGQMNAAQETLNRFNQSNAERQQRITQLLTPDVYNAGLGANAPATRIPGQPNPPQSTNPAVGRAIPGAARPIPKDQQTAWTGTGNQLSAFANFIGGIIKDTFTPVDGEYNPLSFVDNRDILANLMVSPFYRTLWTQATGGSGAAQYSPNAAAQGMNLLQSIAPTEAINGGYRFDPARGYFGEMGSGVGGAFMYGVNTVQNVVGASIYSIADAGMAVNYALAQNPVGAGIINNFASAANTGLFMFGQGPRFGGTEDILDPRSVSSQLVNSDEVAQLGYRYRQAFSGTDLSFTNNRDEQNARANRYLSMIDPNKKGGSYWAQYIIPLGLDFATGGVDDIFTILPRPRINVTASTVRESNALNSGIRLETKVQRETRLAREAQANQVTPTVEPDVPAAQTWEPNWVFGENPQNPAPNWVFSPDLPTNEFTPFVGPVAGNVVQSPEGINFRFEPQESRLATVPNTGDVPTVYRSSPSSVVLATPGSPTAIELYVDNTPSLARPQAIPDNELMLGAVQMRAWLENDALPGTPDARQIKGTTAIVPDGERGVELGNVDLGRATLEDPLQLTGRPSLEGTDALATRERSDLVTTPEPSSDIELAPLDMGTASLEGPRQLEAQGQLPGRASLEGTQTSPQTALEGAQTRGLLPEAQTPTTPPRTLTTPNTGPSQNVLITPAPVMERKAVMGASPAAADRAVRAAVVKEALDNNIVDELEDGVLEYSEAAVREQERYIRRVDRQVKNLEQQRLRARTPQQRLTIDRERIKLAEDLSNAQKDLAELKRSSPEAKALMDAAAPVIKADDLKPGMSISEYIKHPVHATSKDFETVRRTMADLTQLGKFLNGADGKPIVKPTRKSPLNMAELLRKQEMYGDVFSLTGKRIPDAVLKADPLARIEVAQDVLGNTTKTSFIDTPSAVPALKTTVDPSYIDPRFARDKNFNMEEAAKQDADERDQAYRELVQARKQGSAEAILEANRKLDASEAEPGSPAAVEAFTKVAPASKKPRASGSRKAAARMQRAEEKLAEVGQVASELESKLGEIGAKMKADSVDFQSKTHLARGSATDSVLQRNVEGVGVDRSKFDVVHDALEAKDKALSQEYGTPGIMLPKLRGDSTMFDMGTVKKKAAQMGLDPNMNPDELVVLAFSKPEDIPNIRFFNSNDEITRITGISGERSNLNAEVSNIVQQGINTPKTGLGGSLANLGYKKERQILTLESEADKVNKQTWYHGTRVNGTDVSVFHPNKGGSSNVDLGTGLYLTSDPRLGVEYARAARHDAHAADLLTTFDRQGNLHEVIVNTERIMKADMPVSTEIKNIFTSLANEQFGESIAKEYTRVVNRREMTLERMWITLREQGNIDEIQFQLWSADVAHELKRNGIDGISRKSEHLGDDLVLFDTVDGSPLPANTTSLTHGIGAENALDAKLARHHVDALMNAHYKDNPVTNAIELQSRLAVEGQQYQNIMEEYVKALRNGDEAIAATMKYQRELTDAVRKETDEALAAAQKQAPDAAKRNARRQLKTDKDSPCL